MKNILPALLASVLCSLVVPTHTARAQGTQFTYQGRLDSSGSPVNGSNDLTFTLYNAATLGATVGTSNVFNDLLITNGLFTVTLDFPGAFDGNARWLQIAVRPGASVGAYTNLLPRQPITATPYAITAGNLNGLLPSASLSGTYANALTLSNGANSFSGNGAGLTNLNASRLASGTVPAAALSNAWRIGGNAGNAPGAHFIGTTDYQPLEFKVNNQRALRLEPTPSTDTVNVIGGSVRNFVSAGVEGATIGGGGTGEYQGNTYTNQVGANFGTVSGGAANTILPNAQFATVGGGGANLIQSNAIFATIPGGANNSAASYALAAGNRAKANHTGAFVWADSTSADFASTGSNQFLIRAAGGVGINKTNPATALDVNGTVTALNFSGSGAGLASLSASQLTSGTVANARLSNNVSLLGQSIESAEITDGSITSADLNPSLLNGIFWKLGGNEVAPGQFLGSTNNQAVEIRANNQRGLRLEPTAFTDTVNVIGGSARNFVSAGVVGATIGGGGAGDYFGVSYTNKVTGQFGTVGGGLGNASVGNYSTVGGGYQNTSRGFASTIGGGYNNGFDANDAAYGTIGGGSFNTIQTEAVNATIGGGYTNTIGAYAFYATVGGGEQNTIQSAALHATIGGGAENKIQTQSRYATVGGGKQNTIEPGAFHSTIGGGAENRIQTNAHYATIGGGYLNQATNNLATVPGGAGNTAGGQFSFAAGHDAKALHDGTFVWADSPSGGFASTGNDQFLIRAAGGVGINTNNPNGAGLAVHGTVTATGFSGPVAASQLTGTIAASNIGAGSITTASLADGAVTAAKVATVSPSFSLATFTNPTPAADDYFGSSVAAVGSDRLLIGAYFDGTGAVNAGAAYLLSTSGALLATFTNPTPEAEDRFGYSVAAVGSDRVLIGAFRDDTGAPEAGAVYLFSTNGALLTTITNPAPVLGEEFGVSVAAVGSDRLLIGADRNSTAALAAGAAYLFNTNGTLLMTFNNPAPTVGDQFGVSVAAVGIDRVLIGANEDNSGVGAAYLFNTGGALLMTFNNPTPAGGGGFGKSVAPVGSDRVLIGTPYGDTGAGGAGVAYLFNTSGILLTTFTNPTPVAGDGFGNSVAAVGSDRVLIGTPADDTGASDAGAAYLFNTDGMLLATFSNPTPANLDGFGDSVAAVGSDRVLIGARGDNSSTGAAYLFSTETFTPGLVAEGVRAGAVTTTSLAEGAVTAGKLDPTIGVWTRSGEDVFRPTGNVGIGTATPAHKLTVRTPTTDYGFEHTDGDVRLSTFVGGSAGGGWLGTISNHKLSFFVNDGSASMTVDTTGYVGIGMNNPQAPFNVNGSARIDALSFGYGEGLILNLPTDMPGNGYGGIHFHNAARGGALGAGTIKWGLFYNYTPEAGTTGGGLAFVQNNASTRLYLAPSGFVGIGTTTPASALQVIGTVTATAFNPPSDRNLKENFTAVSPREVLDKVVRLTVSRWNFKGDTATPHVGPMAQDFHAAFGLGTDDKHIATVDADGVALAAIQGLNQKLEAEVKSKDTRITELERRLSAIETLLQK